MNETERVRVKIVNVLFDRGNRVYLLKSKSALDVANMAILNFGKFADEKNLFYDIEDDGTALVFIHHCTDLPDGAYYAWQGRIFKDRLPSACPRDHYRVDSRPKRSA